MRKGYFRDGIDQELFHKDHFVMRKFGFKIDGNLLYVAHLSTYYIYLDVYHGHKIKLRIMSIPYTSPACNSTMYHSISSHGNPCHLVSRFRSRPVYLSSLVTLRQFIRHHRFLRLSRHLRKWRKRHVDGQEFFLGCGPGLSTFK